jgi:hypothetical protein
VSLSPLLAATLVKARFFIRQALMRTEQGALENDARETARAGGRLPARVNDLSGFIRVFDRQKVMRGRNGAAIVITM